MEKQDITKNGSENPVQSDDKLSSTLDKIGQSPMTRRSLMTLLGITATAAFLSACESTGSDNHVVSNLPEQPLWPGAGSGPLVPDPENYAPPKAPVYSPPLRPLPKVTSAGGIILREAWARQGPNLRTIDPMNGVRMITFHHSGDPKPFYQDGFAETAQHLEWVREYHRSRNFQDIGYHFAIDRMGRVWQLRSLKYQGQHVRYNNEHNIGVVVLGNFDIQLPTQAQRDRICVFGRTLRNQYGLLPKYVFTHQEIVSTSCPGKNLQPYMKQVRKQGLV